MLVPVAFLHRVGAVLARRLRRKVSDYKTLAGSFNGTVMNRRNKTLDHGNNRRMRQPDVRRVLESFPSAAQATEQGDEILAGALLRRDQLGLQFIEPPLGIHDIEIVGQAA